MQSAVGKLRQMEVKWLAQNQRAKIRTQKFLTFDLTLNPVKQNSDIDIMVSFHLDDNPSHFNEIPLQLL